MQVGVAYSEPAGQTWLRIEVPDETTVQQAIEESGILQKFPHIDLAECKVGIFGKAAELDALLKPGDRVEIYRAITADPATVPRRVMAGDDED
ncbi:MAG: RnfH family protein [Gammaproteobacteria bacterium]|nr:RnfH family protein [Gammaproteobacteria bacterium]MBU1775212.1 RnfH family protein [Gammaproteobacteria bacterium]MBU1968734.1 RnfH family protein [Gammaproteobacteria bacterium]